MNTDTSSRAQVVQSVPTITIVDYEDQDDGSWWAVERNAEGMLMRFWSVDQTGISVTTMGNPDIVIEEPPSPTWSAYERNVSNE
jgi:hypothetical protein